MSDDFANDIDDFQELLDGLPGLTPVVIGKRGGGRKATNNIGADILGETMLKDLTTNHVVDLTKEGAMKANYLYGVIDRNSVARATQISRNIPPSYPQVGVLAVSIARNAEKVVYLQLWKGTVVNGVLTFNKVYSESKDFRYGILPEGKSFWRTDKDGKAHNYSELGTLVVFEDYLNAIVLEAEVPVSFPSEANLQGLSEILANVNSTSTQVDNSTSEFDEEDEEEEV